MESLFAKYGYAPDKERIAKRLDAVAANIDNVTSSEVLKNCMSLMDLTTLRTEDTTESVKKLVEKVNAFMADYPEYPLPASICVYPNFASVVRENLAGKDVRVTAVAGCFPTSQSFVEVKVKECEMAVEAGADEIDIVLALNAFMAGDDDAARAEIRAIRAAIDETASRLGRTVTLKVILETGLLVTPENIAKASLLAKARISSRHPQARSASTLLLWPPTSCANASRPSMTRLDARSASRLPEASPHRRMRFAIIRL